MLHLQVIMIMMKRSATCMVIGYFWAQLLLRLTGGQRIFIMTKNCMG